MARVYSGKKGASGSHKPPIKTMPTWSKLKKEDMEKLIKDLAEKKNTSAVIGTILRDTHGITDSELVTGKSITQIMRENKLYPEFPEDLMFLLRKAVELRRHMLGNRKDRHSKRGLENLESKIRRLSKYYVRTGRMPKTWNYDPEQARLIVEKW